MSVFLPLTYRFGHLKKQILFVNDYFLHGILLTPDAVSSIITVEIMGSRQSVRSDLSRPGKAAVNYTPSSNSSPSLFDPVYIPLYPYLILYNQNWISSKHNYNFPFWIGQKLYPDII